MGGLLIRIDKEQLAYYEKELQYLRQQGADFAKSHPKVAASLGMSLDDIADPQVERLIESFAFLTSTLNRKYDDMFPEVAQTLLDVLYPQLVAPIPPMTMTHFSLDPSKGKSTTGQEIPKGTELYINSEKGDACRFKTAYDLTLWPISIEDVVVEPSQNYEFYNAFSPYPYLLRINLKTLAKKLHEYKIDTLCFYIDADHFISNWLFECLFLKDNPYAILNPETKQHKIIRQEDAIQRVGFTENESVLPEFPQASPSFNILQEYFAFPQKFMFFRLSHLDFSHIDSEAHLLIPLTSYEDTLKKNLQVTKDMIKLGCTPAINLFTHLTDPIDFNKQSLFYPLIPDIQKQKTLEIHTVLDVYQTTRFSKDVKKISPYFSYDHGDVSRNQKYFYDSKVSNASNMPGTQTHITFMNLDSHRDIPVHETIYARVLCSNRDLATFILPGSQLNSLTSIPVNAIKVLTQPTPSIYNPGGGYYYWQLISQLTTDFIILGSQDKETALKVVREAINVFKRQVSTAMVTDGGDVIGFETDQIVRRIGRDAWRGFLNGVSYKMTLSEASFSKKDALLFSAVLDTYFKNFAYTVSFTELNIYNPNQKEVWKIWPVQEL